MTGSKDVFGRKHLAVLNVAPPQLSPTVFVLDDPGSSSEPWSGSISELETAIIAALRTVHDPEIPLNIYDLGLVYRVACNDERRVEIDMTLTSPGCPVAGVLIQQVHDCVRKVPGVTSVRTELVWEPTWTQARMSDAAKLALGLL